MDEGIRREIKGTHNEKKRGLGRASLWLSLPFFLFLLAVWKQHRKKGGMRVSLGSSLWGIVNQLSLRVGMSAGGGVGFL